MLQDRGCLQRHRTVYIHKNIRSLLIINSSPHHSSTPHDPTPESRSRPRSRSKTASCPPTSINASLNSSSSSTHAPFPWTSLLPFFDPSPVPVPFTRVGRGGIFSLVDRADSASAGGAGRALAGVGAFQPDGSGGRVCAVARVPAEARVDREKVDVGFKLDLRLVPALDRDVAGTAAGGAGRVRGKVVDVVRTGPVPDPDAGGATRTGGDGTPAAGSRWNIGSSSLSSAAHQPFPLLLCSHQKEQ